MNMRRPYNQMGVIHAHLTVASRNLPPDKRTELQNACFDLATYLAELEERVAAVEQLLRNRDAVEQLLRNRDESYGGTL